jgi:hypothetical protein
MTCCYYIITTHSPSLVARSLVDQAKSMRWWTCGTQHTIGWRDKTQIQNSNCMPEKCEMELKDIFLRLNSSDSDLRIVMRLREQFRGCF